MRRSLAAAIPVVPALAAGCTSETPKSGAVPGPSASVPFVATSALPPPASAGASASGSGDRALAGNTKAICDQATRTSAAFGETFLADLKLQIDAASQGPAAKAQAQQKIARDVGSYSSALAGMADLADDKDVKQALTQMGKQVKELQGDLTKIDAGKVAEISATLDRACGRG